MGEGSRLRIVVIGFVTLTLFSVLFARLWYLQVISTESYAAAAEGNRIRTVPREAPRGRILDRRGRILVDNRVSNVVAVSRTLAGQEREEVISRLAEILRQPREELESRLEDFRFADFRPIPVATDVDEATLLAIREREDELPGVEASQVAIRVYPNGNVAAHVLGYVGEINDEELEDRQDEYRLGDTIGKVGVERAYEPDLRGEPGVEFWEVDRSGRVIRSLGEQEPQQGDDVQLGIDLDVQRAAEEALAGQIETVRERGMEAPGGAVVVLDAQDGGVVAMASSPSFDPSQFVHGIRTEVWDELNDPENDLPLNNRAIQGQYPTASTFKVVSGLAGVTSGMIGPHETIRDQGSIEIGGRLFRNAQSRSYGIVDLRRALTVSSDVYFYKLGFEINSLIPNTRAEEIQRIARLYGFGQPTGIELPFEQVGRVPDRKWKREVHRANPEAFPEGTWFAGDNVNVAIGQGDILATPLQVASAYSALANGGDVLRPHVGARVIDRFGAVVREVEPVVASEVPFDQYPEVRDIMLRGLRGVVNDEEGTAYHAFLGYEGPPVAGKTGTAQIRGKEDTSLFVGMVPADQPRYVVMALVEEAGAGSAVAAPIVRKVIEAINATEADPALPPVGTTRPPEREPGAVTPTSVVGGSPDGDSPVVPG